jgi:hypothetical protein
VSQLGQRTKSNLHYMSAPRPDRTCQRAGVHDRRRYGVLADSLLD